MKRLSNLQQPVNFVKIQEEKTFDDYRYAGKITARCLSLLEKLVKDKTSKTLLELDKIAEEFFISCGTEPVFKGYHGFPASVCMSVNDQLVHGIPTDYKIQDGDIVSFDTGCKFNGAIADSALTCIFGNPKEESHVKLVQSTKNALYAGIKSIKISSKVGSIGNAVYRSSKASGHKVIEQYTGHGISLHNVHSDPPILNKAEPDDGVRIREGMVMAIEPLLVLGDSVRTTISDDNWTVMSDNLSAHFEHSVLVTESKVEVISLREEEIIL